MAYDGLSGSYFTNFFFATAVNVTPGTMYFLQPFVVNGDPSTCITVGAPYGYQGGDEYVSGSINPAADMWFREGVVPEPSTWALLLTGTVLLYPRKRR